MAKLFLDGIFDVKSDSPSTVRIFMPRPSEKSNFMVNLRGLISGDITFSAQNKWGPIINDVANLQDLASLMGSDSMFSWISASTMCWKGTSPLSIGIEFYMINYSKDLDTEGQLRNFVKLASLTKDNKATVGQNYKVLAHGGYAADILSGNKKYFDNKGMKETKDLLNLSNHFNFQDYENDLFDSNNIAQGALVVKFGNKSTISNLLLSKVGVTESVIEVADQNGGNRRPLFYRVSAQFTGVRPLLTMDVDEMFKFAV